MVDVGQAACRVRFCVVACSVFHGVHANANKSERHPRQHDTWILQSRMSLQTLDAIFYGPNDRLGDDYRNALAARISVGPVVKTVAFAIRR